VGIANQGGETEQCKVIRRLGYIRFGKNASSKKPSWRPWPRTPLLHDAMELGVTIEILGVPMYTGSFW
jgi:hypothetical protein